MSECCVREMSEADAIPPWWLAEALWSEVPREKQDMGLLPPTTPPATRTTQKRPCRQRSFSVALHIQTEGSDEGDAQKIRWCDQISDLYDFGGEVMTSCHPGMRIRFATQRLRNLKVVIKERNKDESFQTEEDEQQWRSSTEAMLKLPENQNIAQLYEVLEDADSYYVVMEKCGGRDLCECVHKRVLLQPGEVKLVMKQILSALAEMHARGVIHKDVKLENVMLERTPSTASGGDSPYGSEASALSVKIVDFDTVEGYTPETPKQAKAVLGTDQYISPEAYEGKYSPASDVFAVGVIGYRLLVGEFPFDSRLFDDKPGENWVGSPKMGSIRQRLHRFQVKYEHKAFQLEPAACELIQSLLLVQESDRPSAQEALQHRWLADESALH